MNIIDKAIAYFNPVAGMKRAAARSAISMYEAGGQGRRMKSWNDRGGSASSATENIRTVRDRSHQLERNNPWATRAIESIAVNTVGVGIVPTFSGTAGVVKKVEKLWKEWADKTVCDFDGDLNFYGLQELVMRTVAESGEAFVRYRVDYSIDMPFRVQVLESEFCDASKSGTMLENGGWIVQGIEFDKNGKRVAYWLFNQHPDDIINMSGLTSNRVPADEVIHVFRKKRPGQVRGVPTGVQSFMRLRDFDDYEDAQLVRQKMAACHVAAVYKNEVPDDPTGSALDDDAEELDRMEPGQYQYLNPGEEIQFNNPPAVDGYDEYSRKILQGVAASYGVTYEVISGDYSNVNFSSGRMGWIEMHRNIGSLQWNMFIPKFCNGVMEWFIKFGTIKGHFKTFGYEWTAPRREMIDPVKETKALSEQVRNGFKSWTEAVTETGQDANATFDQLVKEKEARDKAGLQLVCDPRFDSGKDIQGAQGEAEDEDEPAKPASNKK